MRTSGLHPRLKAESQVAVMWATCTGDGDLSPITPSDRETDHTCTEDIVHASNKWWERWQVCTDTDVSKSDLKLNDMGFDDVRAVFS